MLFSMVSLFISVFVHESQRTLAYQFVRIFDDAHIEDVSVRKYSPVPNSTSVPNSTHGSRLKKNTLQIVLMVIACNFSTIQI